MRCALNLLLMATLLSVPAVAHATVTITAGDHIPSPNSPGQLIDILIRADAGESINGMDFAISINNEDGFGSGAPAPIITGVDLNETNSFPGTALSGSANVFFDNAANPSTNFSPGLDPPGLGVVVSVAFNNTSFDLPIPVTDTVLATVEFDTTGVPNGLYSIDLFHPFFGDLFLGDTATGFVPVTFASSALIGGTNPNFFVPRPHDGSIAIGVLPEPSSIVLGVFAACGFAVVAIRKRRRTA